MSRISNTVMAENSNKQYISLQDFTSFFYSYTTFVDATKTRRGLLKQIFPFPAGGFTTDPGTPKTGCPAGRILGVSGRKLIPGVNPMDYINTVGNKTIITKTGPAIFKPKFYLGVVDVVTGVNGFIDTNAFGEGAALPTESSKTTGPMFVVFDSNRPITSYLDDVGEGGLTVEEVDSSSAVVSQVGYTAVATG